MCIQLSLATPNPPPRQKGRRCCQGTTAGADDPLAGCDGSDIIIYEWLEELFQKQWGKDARRRDDEDEGRAHRGKSYA